MHALASSSDMRALDTKHAGARKPGGATVAAAPTAPIASGAALARLPLAAPVRRVVQLTRRLPAGVAAAGRASLDALATAWGTPPPLPAAASRARRPHGPHGRGRGAAPIVAFAPSSSPSPAAAAAAANVAAALPDDQDLTVDLDWKARLTFMQEVICWHTAAAVCCVAYALTAPAAVSVPYGTCIGVLFGLVLVFMRSSMMEVLYKVGASCVAVVRHGRGWGVWIGARRRDGRTSIGGRRRKSCLQATLTKPKQTHDTNTQTQAKERFETDLGDPDSVFHTHANLQVHVKAKLPRSAAGAAATGAGSAGGVAAAVHCYHGFGSNTWSWSLVQQALADRLGALVTAHDMPGFGLTERPGDLSGYYLAFNGRLGRLVMDHELRQAGALTAAQAAAAEKRGFPGAHVHESAAPAAPAAAPAAPAVAAPAAPAAPTAAAAAERPSTKDGTLTFSRSDLSKSWDQVNKAVAAVPEAPAAAPAAPAAPEPAPAPAPAPVPAPAQPQAPPQPPRRVLMGHSLGGACAALEAIARGGDYAALVLVDPAILVGLGAGAGKAAWLEQLHDDSALTRAHGGGAAAGGAAAGAGSTAAANGGDELDRDLDREVAAAGGLARADTLSNAGAAAPAGGQWEGAKSPSGGYTARAAGAEVAYYVARGAPEIKDPAAAPPPGPIGNVLGAVVAALRATVIGAVVALILLLRPLVLLGLRAAVRSRNFWKSTLEQAYYDRQKVSPAAVDAYRLPQLVRGWEAGMVRFLLARLGARAPGADESPYAAAAAAAAGGAGAGRSPGGGLEDAGLAQRLAAAAARHKLPVLLVHGAGDKLVPVSNTLNLAKMIPGARVAVLKRSGHCPQEEQPEAFAQIVSSFLGATLAAAPAAAPAAQ